MGSASTSSDLHQAYQDHSSHLSDLLEKLPVPEGACGAVFACGGRIVGADLFDKSATLAKLWPKLIRAYALDALEDNPETAATATPAAVKDWLRTALAAQAQAFKSPGVGDDVRLEGTSLVGAGLFVGDHPVHVELFPSEMPA